MSRLEEIKKRHEKLKIESGLCGQFSVKVVTYDPLMLCDDLNWLIERVGEHERQAGVVKEHGEKEIDRKDAEIEQLEARLAKAEDAIQAAMKKREEVDWFLKHAVKKLREQNP